MEGKARVPNVLFQLWEARGNFLKLKILVFPRENLITAVKNWEEEKGGRGV